MRSVCAIDSQIGPDTWFIKFIGFRVVNIEECIVSILREYVKENIGLEHD